MGFELTLSMTPRAEQYLTSENEFVFKYLLSKAYYLIGTRCSFKFLSFIANLASALPQNGRNVPKYRQFGEFLPLQD